MKAKNREQYVTAWKLHVAQLVHIFLDADAPLNDWEAAKEMLQVFIERAADNTFPKEAK
jgi:hypothetical protein